MAWAQGVAGMAGYGGSDLVPVRATVTALDLEKKTITLTGAEGGQLTMTFGNNIAKLDTINIGEPVITHSDEAVTDVLSPWKTKIPENGLSAVTALTPPGALPAEAVATRLTVTPLVVDINRPAHRISLVDPDGGKVRALLVKSAHGQEMLNAVNVGDTIAAFISKAVAVAIEAAT